MNHKDAVAALARRWRRLGIGGVPPAGAARARGLPGGRDRRGSDLPGPTPSFHLSPFVGWPRHGAAATGASSALHGEHEPRVNALVGYLTEHCCSLGSACVILSARPPSRAARAPRASKVTRGRYAQGAPLMVAAAAPPIPCPRRPPTCRRSALLQAAALPVTDLAPAPVEFLVATMTGLPVGAIGLERHGSKAACCVRWSSRRRGAVADWGRAGRGC